MINKKDLENDPDNALPWELLAKDNDVPEVNEVQEMIKHRSEKRDRDYKNFAGLPVFERGKGSRPESGRATVHSSASSAGRPVCILKPSVDNVAVRKQHKSIDRI
jgi:hypothetical protein